MDLERFRSPGFAFFAFPADEYNVLARCKYKYNPFFEQDRYLPAIGRRALLTFRGTAVEILGDPSDLGLRDQWQRRLRKQYAYITCGTHGGSMLTGSKSSELAERSCGASAQERLTLGEQNCCKTRRDHNHVFTGVLVNCLAASALTPVFLIFPHSPTPTLQVPWSGRSCRQSLKAATSQAWAGGSPVCLV